MHIDDKVNNRIVKPVQHLAGYKEMSEVEVESGWIQSWKSIKQQYC